VFALSAYLGIGREHKSNPFERPYRYNAQFVLQFLKPSKLGFSLILKVLPRSFLSLKREEHKAFNKLKENDLMFYQTEV